MGATARRKTRWFWDRFESVIGRPAVAVDGKSWPAGVLTIRRLSALGARILGLATGGVHARVERGETCPGSGDLFLGQSAGETASQQGIKMPDPGNLVPFSDEQAKAVQEALKTLQGVGGFLRKMFGTVPEDVVALLGGNLLKVRRAENLLRTIQRAHERLKKDGIKPEAASLSIGLPILIAAADESRDELQDLWARLLAAAADPARSKSFRNAFIEVIKKMDPLDAAVLQAAQAEGGRMDGGKVNSIAARLTLSNDQVVVSVENLEKLGIFIRGPATPPSISPLGREFLRMLKT